MLSKADLRQHCIGCFPAKQRVYSLGWYCTSNILVQCCLRPIFTTLHKKNLLQCCLNTAGTTLHRLKPCAMLTLRLQTTIHRKKLWIVFNMVLILLEWHCSGKNLLQCCLFNTPGTTLHRLKPYAMLSLRLQTALHKKNPVQYCLNILGTILYRKNPMLCCPRGSKQHSIAKKSSVMSKQHLVTFWQFLLWIGWFFNNNRLQQMLCQHCSNLGNIAKEKSQTNIEQKDRIVWNNIHSSIYLILGKWFQK